MRTTAEHIKEIYLLMDKHLHTRDIGIWTFVFPSDTITRLFNM